MSTPIQTDRVAEAPPRAAARGAGFFWLMTILCGSFAVTGTRLVVYGDAAATAANITAHEAQYRLAYTANLVGGVCYIAATLLVYVLLKPVNRNVSLLAAFFSLAGCAVSAVSFIFGLAPFAILSGGQEPGGFDAGQLQSLALVFLRLGGLAFSIGHVFFGLHCLLVGYLAMRSSFLPRLVGALMLLAGAGWLTMSFANLLAPSLGRSLFPYILLPGVLGEGSLSLWLLAKGVDIRRWKERVGQGSSAVSVGPAA